MLLNDIFLIHKSVQYDSRRVIKNTNYVYRGKLLRAHGKSTSFKYFFDKTVL